LKKKEEKKEGKNRKKQGQKRERKREEEENYSNCLVHTTSLLNFPSFKCVLYYYLFLYTLVFILVYW